MISVSGCWAGKDSITWNAFRPLIMIGSNRMMIGMCLSAARALAFPSAQAAAMSITAEWRFRSERGTTAKDFTPGSVAQVSHALRLDGQI
jgi:hypothetical protein